MHTCFEVLEPRIIDCVSSFNLPSSQPFHHKMTVHYILTQPGNTAKSNHQLGESSLTKRLHTTRISQHFRSAGMISEPSLGNQDKSLSAHTRLCKHANVLSSSDGRGEPFQSLDLLTWAVRVAGAYFPKVWMVSLDREPRGFRWRECGSRRKENSARAVKTT